MLCCTNSRVCVQVHIQNTHTHTHIRHSSSSIKIIQDHCLLIPNGSVPFTLLPSQPLHQAKKPPQRMDRKRKRHCRGKEEATLIKETPKSPGRSENLTRPENGRFGRIRCESNMEADHGGPCRPYAGRGPSPSPRPSARRGTTEQGDTVWFVFHSACWGWTGIQCLREAVKDIRNHTQLSSLEPVGPWGSWKGGLRTNGRVP